MSCFHAQGRGDGKVDGIEAESSSNSGANHIERIGGSESKPRQFWANDDSKRGAVGNSDIALNAEPSESFGFVGEART
jgi:hypothetical protein